MERFRLRVHDQPKRGNIWELHLFPDHPYRLPQYKDARCLGSASHPETIHWLRQVAAPFLQRAEPPIPAEEFGPSSKHPWLRSDDGMILALAFSAARYLTSPQQRQLFRKNLDALPSEVLLYWFTLCFYGYRQAAGRAALRTLLTYEDPRSAETSSRPSMPAAPRAAPVAPDAELAASVREGLVTYAAGLDPTRLDFAGENVE